MTYWHVCKQYPGEGGVYAAIGVGEEFFILLRHDAQKTEVVISDGAALLDWDLAEDAADLIELDWEEGELRRVRSGRRPKPALELWTQIAGSLHDLRKPRSGAGSTDFRDISSALALNLPGRRSAIRE